MIGRPFMPPYWTLGFHLCRYGYNRLDRLIDAVNRTRQYNIPHVSILTLIFEIEHYVNKISVRNTKVPLFLKGVNQIIYIHFNR